MRRHITLVYVPNQFCNFGCKYCYLGALTDNVDKHSDITSNLKRAVEEIEKSGDKVGKFTLHGAEVSTIPEKYLDEMFTYMNEYHKKEPLERELATRNLNSRNIHIKTNLYNFDKLQPLFKKHQVGISASFDLPFSLHEKFRVDKKGNSTLDKVLSNIKLLKDYEEGIGLSCVITKAHLEMFDDVVKDLRYMNDVVGFDMKRRFYFMFGYDSSASEDKFGDKIEGTEMLSQEEMVEFYNKIKKEFVGTEFEEAIKYNWFKEFQGGYCTDNINCGSSQFLLQKNGDMYPCHRTQPDEAYKYGNIFEDGFEYIKENATKVIIDNEKWSEMTDDCVSCDYFKYCQMGCSLIRKETRLDRNYTCKLQLELYKDNPLRYPVPPKKEKMEILKRFILENKPNATDEFVRVYPKRDAFILTPEIHDDKFKLGNIVDRDPELKTMYESGIFKLIVNDVIIPLDSGIFKTNRIYDLLDDAEVLLEVDKRYFGINCPEHSLSGNSLVLSMLRATPVSYGEEGRTKQEHMWDNSIYYNQLLEKGFETEYGTIIYDISMFVHCPNNEYIDGVPNLLIFTSKNAKAYHYEKQAKDAFYHIQAINIPFHNIQFFHKINPYREDGAKDIIDNR